MPPKLAGRAGSPLMSPPCTSDNSHQPSRVRRPMESPRSFFWPRQPQLATPVGVVRNGGNSCIDPDYLSVPCLVFVKVCEAVSRICRSGIQRRLPGLDSSTSSSLSDQCRRASHSCNKKMDLEVVLILRPSFQG